jgi:hypothetical protein
MVAKSNAPKTPKIWKLSIPHKIALSTMGIFHVPLNYTFFIPKYSN